MPIMYRITFLAVAATCNLAAAVPAPRAANVCSQPWAKAAEGLIHLLPQNEGVDFCSSLIHKYATQTTTSTKIDSTITGTSTFYVTATAPRATITSTDYSTSTSTVVETDTIVLYDDVDYTAPSSTTTETTITTKIMDVTSTDTSTIDTTTIETDYFINTATITTTSTVTQASPVLTPSPAAQRRRRDTNSLARKSTLSAKVPKALYLAFSC